MKEILNSLNSIPGFILAIFSFIIIGFAKKIIDEDLSKKRDYDNIIIKLFNKVRFKGYSIEEAINYLHSDFDYCTLPDDFKYCLYTKDYSSMESIIYIEYLKSKKTRNSMNIRYISFIDPYINAFSSTLFFIGIIASFVLISLLLTLVIAVLTVHLLKVSDETYLLYMILCLSFVVSTLSIGFALDRVAILFSKKNKDLSIEDIEKLINRYNEKYQEYRDDGFDIKLDINTSQHQSC